MLFGATVCFSIQHRRTPGGWTYPWRCGWMSIVSESSPWRNLRVGNTSGCETMLGATFEACLLKKEPNVWSWCGILRSSTWCCREREWGLPYFLFWLAPTYGFCLGLHEAVIKYFWVFGGTRWISKVRKWNEILPDQVSFQNAYRVRKMKDDDTEQTPVPHCFTFMKRSGNGV